MPQSRSNNKNNGISIWHVVSSPCGVVVGGECGDGGNVVHGGGRRVRRCGRDARRAARGGECPPRRRWSPSPTRSPRSTRRAKTNSTRPGTTTTTPTTPTTSRVATDPQVPPQVSISPSGTTFAGERAFLTVYEVKGKQVARLVVIDTHAFNDIVQHYLRNAPRDIKFKLTV